MAAELGPLLIGSLPGIETALRLPTVCSFIFVCSTFMGRTSLDTNGYRSRRFCKVPLS